MRKSVHLVGYSHVYVSRCAIQRMSVEEQRETEKRIVAIPFLIKRTGPHVWNEPHREMSLNVA